MRRRSLGESGCSMKITEEIRKFDSEQGVDEEEALKKGMQEQSKEFVCGVGFRSVREGGEIMTLMVREKNAILAIERLISLRPKKRRSRGSFCVFRCRGAWWR